jgi:SAM-dependent methyltransferase
MTQNTWQQYFDSTAHRYMAEEYAQPWKQEVDFYLEVLNLSPRSRILDLGCGPGRHSVELARRGYEVTGVDLSAGMLAEAQKAAQAAGVKVEFVQANAVDFVATYPFDAILCMLEAAIGFYTVDEDPLTHDLTILRNVNQSLKPDGYFLLGLSNAYKCIRDYKQEQVESGFFDPVTMIQAYSLTWTTAAGEEGEGKCRFRAYLPTEISLLLKQAGLAVEHIWGGTHGYKKIGLDDYIITLLARKG